MSNSQIYKHLPLSHILRQRTPQTCLDILASSTCCSIFFSSHTSFFMAIILTVPIYLSIHHTCGPLCRSNPWLLFCYLTVSTAFSWNFPTISPTFCASVITPCLLPPSKTSDFFIGHADVLHGPVTQFPGHFPGSSLDAVLGLTFSKVFLSASLYLNSKYAWLLTCSHFTEGPQVPSI